MVDFNISGKVLDWNGNPVEGIYVKAFHHNNIDVNSKAIWPFFYLGKSEKTGTNGEFDIAFPIFASWDYSMSVYPNISLRITDQTVIIYEGEVNNHAHTGQIFEIEIPDKYTYSDEVSHFDWKLVIANLLESTGRNQADLDELIPALIKPLKDAHYLSEDGRKEVGYRGAIVPPRPKEETHVPHIPWYDAWEEEQ